MLGIYFVRCKFQFSNFSHLFLRQNGKWASVIDECGSKGKGIESKGPGRECVVRVLSSLPRAGGTSVNKLRHTSSTQIA